MCLKISLIITLSLITSNLFAQEKNPCDCLYSLDASMSLGGSTAGPTENIEVGLWGRKNNIGISGGLMLYSGKQIMNKKLNIPYTPLMNELYIRPTYKLDHKLIMQGFHHAITIFAGTKGNYGISYRAYYQFSFDFMLGLEPYTSVQTGKGLNFITTFAF